MKIRCLMTYAVFSVLVFVTAGCTVSGGGNGSDKSCDDFLASSIADIDQDCDGTVDSRRTIAFTYDANGNRLTLVNETDSDSNGLIDSRSTSIYTYDANDYRLTWVIESDNDNNGTIESVSTRTYTNDTDGNALTEMIETDSDNNGTIDSLTDIANEYVHICSDNLADYDPWGDLTAN